MLIIRYKRQCVTFTVCRIVLIFFVVIYSLYFINPCYPSITATSGLFRRNKMQRGPEAQHQAEQCYRPTRGWWAERPQTKKQLRDFLAQLEKSMHELNSLFNDSLSSNNPVLLQHFHGIFKESVISLAVELRKLTHPFSQTPPDSISNTSSPPHFDMHPQGSACVSPRRFQVEWSSKNRNWSRCSCH